MRVLVPSAAGLFLFGTFLQCSASPQGAPNPPASSAQATAAAEPSDNSKEALVIEQMSASVDFSDDGIWREERSARIRMQSEAGVQQFGVLTFSYQNDTERLEILQIRVTKPDGTVVSTPESNAQDLAAEVARVAPTYSDAREKQVPVKALGVGDVLEWKTRTTHTKADVPGQFWYAHSFTKSAAVLEETLRIGIPAGKTVKVSSPSLKAEIRQEGNRKVYFWKTSHRQDTGGDKKDDEKKDDEKDSQPTLRFRPDVQLTTFQSWEDVGRWYGGLQKTRLELTPAVRAKAGELTAGLKTEAEKQRAIYQFVSAKFRYISISFGQGRYQPHAADEVLANQYGDCKDKHTLLAALLKAAGIEAWPVLIGAGIELDPDVPSPAQFNHVITYLPHGDSPTWLDATPEVAPYGMLQFVLRDQKALLIPDSGAPRLVTTPATLPFPAAETISVDAKLSPEGTLTGHFDISERGDAEVMLRSVFHSSAPAQWPTLAKSLASAMGQGETVHGLDVENLNDLDAPFHFSYDFEQKTYSDWTNRRITPPLPVVSLAYSDQDKPTKPIELGSTAKTTYRAKLKLPEGYSAEIPDNVKLQTEIADYSATYAVDSGVLTAERVLSIKIPKVEVSKWEAYRSLAKAVANDQNQYMQLARADATAGVQVTRNSADAAELVQKAYQAMSNRDLNSAREALAQAERINERQLGLWAGYGSLYGMQNENDKAIECLEKELRYHSGSQGLYPYLAALQRQAGRKEDEIDTRRRLVAIAPGNLDAVLALSSVLIENKKFDEAATAARAALKADANNPRLELALGEALVRGGNKTEGLAALGKMREHSPDDNMLNTAAWALVETGTSPALARDLSAEAVANYENQLKGVSLAALTTEQLRTVNSLGATWDTLGWAYYLLGDLKSAEGYIKAAWLLLQHSTAGDHLGQIYERQGKKDEAIHVYRLSLAVTKDLPETQARLEKLGGSFEDRPTLRRGKLGTPLFVSPQDELSRLRTTPIPSLATRKGSAEFFLLFSSAGVEDVRFISGDEELKSASGVLGKTHYQVELPDSGPEEIPRRGILSCSAITTPSCTFILLLPANTTR